MRWTKLLTRNLRAAGAPSCRRKTGKSQHPMLDRTVMLACCDLHHEGSACNARQTASVWQCWGGLRAD